MRALAAILLLSITGCATSNGESAVRQRAGFDLNCPNEQIRVQELGDKMYGATGCGKRATYVTNRCWSGDLEGCKAVLNGVSTDSP
jgi:hypothetical protein